jgi:hypothetical protein
MSIYQPIIQKINVSALPESITKHNIHSWFAESKIAIISKVEIVNPKRDVYIYIDYFLHSESANQFMCDIEIQTSLGNPIIYNIKNSKNQLVPIKMILSK